jgi:transitional endoplasmic reticulum ATPase
VVGLDDVREALLEAIELPLLHEDLLREYNVEPIKGILLFGPQGCGKTMIVKAAANELNATFFFLSGADLLKMGYDGAVTEIKNTFNRAKENPPAIIFIDEVDAIAPSREIASATPLGEKLVAQLLNEMDGVKELKNVLFIGATNRPEVIDPAMLRPGRFDKIIFIHPPFAEGRAKIFELNLKGVPKAPDVDFARLAKYTDGYTGADIASICQEAKMRLVRGRLAGKRKELHQSDLLEIISQRKPSVTPQMLESYMRFLREYGERR